MRTALLASLITIGAVLASQSCLAADPQAGKQLAQNTCSACHGTGGIGIASIYPNLAGQKADYLIAQLKAFRDGSRKNPIMEPMAAHLTDADIENVATYFSSLKTP